MSVMQRGPLTSEMNQTDPILTENARKVLEARYLKKNEAGEAVETPADLFHRVADTIADVELVYGASEQERNWWGERFYRLMTSGDFMPNSPTLMNAGREMGMLSACFVLPVRDSIVDIFNSIKHTAMIQKAGGGTGFAFDELRPTGDFIASSGGTTSGPITFWRAFSEATNAIQQGAFRRGANMGMMYIHHPDILKFLHAKQDLNQFTNYNISVKITDNWMNEFRADPDSPHFVRNPRNGRTFVLPRDLDIWKYDVRNLIEVECVEPVSPVAAEKYFTSPVQTDDLPEDLRGKVYTKREIWNIIVKNAHATGEPGVVFIDRINEKNPTPHVGRIEATNPCGEQPLLPYEACNLGSVNLGNFVREACTEGAYVDWDALRECVYQSTRFLDNVIDANNYPLAEIDNICKSNRKIGLGIMGFADALFKLGVAYNSDEGVAWGERFMQFVNDEAHNAGERLARTRGPFPNWKGSIWHTEQNRLMRNAATTTVAPTGTISIISNCSGGIEPMFSLAFIRNVLKGQKQGEKPLVEVNDTFLAVAKARGFYSEELIERIAREGTLAHIDEVPEDVKQVFVCAHDITPEWHMQMQAAFQQHCDSSISKTINFPHEASEADVEQIYHLAFELKCKGVTVYRDGCRNCQPMALKKEEGGKKSDEVMAPKAEVQAEPKAAVKPDSRLEASTAAAGMAPRLEPVPTAPRSAATRSAARVLTGGAEGSAPPNGAHSRGAQSEPAINNAQTARRAPEAKPVPNPQANSSSALRRSAAASAGSTSAASSAPAPAPFLEPMDLPEIVSGLRIRQMTPFGNMHVKITVDPRTNRELEVFAQLGKGGDVATSDLEAVCRMISLWLRAGGSLRHVIKQLEGIGSSLQIPTRAGRIMSLGDGLACALKKYTKAKERFGLRSLLLGEVDLATLDSLPPPHGNADAHDCAPAVAERGPSAKGANGANGAHAAGNGDDAANGAHAPAANVPAARPTVPAPAAPHSSRLSPADIAPERSATSRNAGGAGHAAAPSPRQPLNNPQPRHPQPAPRSPQPRGNGGPAKPASRPADSRPGNPQRNLPRLNAPQPPQSPANFAGDGVSLADADFASPIDPGATIEGELVIDEITAGLADDVRAALDAAEPHAEVQFDETVSVETLTAVVELESNSASRTAMDTTLLTDEEIAGDLDLPLVEDDAPETLSDSDVAGALAEADLQDTASHEDDAALYEVDLSEAALEAALDADLAEEAAGGAAYTSGLIADAALTGDADPTADLTLNIDDLLKSVRHTHDSAAHYKLKCPHCDDALVLQEGCKICFGCGWSAC